MKNLLVVAALALVCLGLAGPVAAGDRAIVFTIVVEPGMTDFTHAGESFTVVTTQRLEINFEGITPHRVWGFLLPLDGYNLDPVKFIWTTAGNDPLTLHEGVLGGRRWFFDSNNVTGHNEKFD